MDLRGRHTLVLCATLLVACDLDADPTTPCPSLDIADADHPMLDVRSPTVLALSDSLGNLRVIDRCDTCTGGIRQRTLPATTAQGVRQILLAGSGSTLAYIDGAANLQRVDLRDEALVPVETVVDVERLVGSLRASDFAIFSSKGRLHAAYVGPDTADLPPELADLADGRELGEGVDDLLPVALGDRTLVARRIVGDEEELWLVRVHPASRDEGGIEGAGSATLLARGRPFQRVAITRAASPSELGDEDAFLPEVPRDGLVIATSGQGEDARTLVFRVLDGVLLENFPGSVNTSVVRLDDLAGLSAVSPDASQLAYVTPSGALALRDLEDGDACLVRPASAGEHQIAGFGADATLYFESADPDDARRIYAWIPSGSELQQLTESTFRLKAAPAVRFAANEFEQAPVAWSVVAQDGLFHAASETADPLGLAYDTSHLSFLHSDATDDSMWAVEASEDETETPGHFTLRLRRLKPVAGDEGLDFDVTTEPSLPDGQPFAMEYTLQSKICVATNDPVPWSTTCSTHEDAAPFLQDGLPQF